MTTHETVNRLYAEIQTHLQRNYGAEGKGVFAMLKSVEGKLGSKLVWELRMIANIRNLVVHECLEPVPRYFEALCSEAIESMRPVQAAHASKTNSSAPAKDVKQSPARSTPVPLMSKVPVKPQATNAQAAKQPSQKKPVPKGQRPAQKTPHPQNSKPQMPKQQAPKQHMAKPQPSPTKRQP